MKIPTPRKLGVALTLAVGLSACAHFSTTLSGWIEAGSGAAMVAVVDHGDRVVVTEGNGQFRVLFADGTTQRMDLPMVGTWTAIASGERDLYALVAGGDRIDRYDFSDDYWVPVERSWGEPDGAVDLAVGADDSVYVVSNTRISRWVDGVEVANRALDFGGTYSHGLPKVSVDRASGTVYTAATVYTSAGGRIRVQRFSTGLSPQAVDDLTGSKSDLVDIEAGEEFVALARTVGNQTTVTVELRYDGAGVLSLADGDAMNVSYFPGGQDGSVLSATGAESGLCPGGKSGGYLWQARHYAPSQWHGYRRTLVCAD